MINEDRDRQEMNKAKADERESELTKLMVKGRRKLRKKAVLVHCLHGFLPHPANTVTQNLNEIRGYDCVATFGKSLLYAVQTAVRIKYGSHMGKINKYIKI